MSHSPASGQPPLFGMTGPLGASNQPMMVPPSGQNLKASRQPAVKTLASPVNVFVAAGVILLSCVCILPVVNAIALLQDVNYVFWHGTTVPTWMLSLCAAVMVVYVMAVVLFFGTAGPRAPAEQTIMTLANIFLILLGLALMMLSLPLSQQATDTYNNLMHHCDFSEQTHRMYEYSQVLHNIRRMPGCAQKYTVEECDGYEDAPPYTNFLKALESDFRCSGFCYKPPSQIVGKPQALLSKPSKSLRRKSRTQQRGEVALLGGGQNSSRAERSALASNEFLYPPTLFTDANYQASCEGMAARDMKNFAGDVGFQTFYQGVYLVVIAIATGFLKLIGFCVNGDHDGMKQGIGAF